MHYISFHKTGKVVFALVLVCFFSAVNGCANQIPAQSEFVLGTVCTVNLYNRGNAKVYREIFSRLREIESRMSANMDGTDVEAVNANAGIAPVAVHRDVLEVVQRSLYFAELTGGAFDPTVGPLVKLWNIGSDDARIPRQEEIDAVLPLVNWRNVRVDEDAGTVFLTEPGMRLDLGAIAKGYAADEAARIIAKARIPRAIIDLGGNVYAYGTKEGGAPWRIGIQNPSGLRGSYLGIMEVRDKTMVTSGVYERFFESGGIRYHHILSGKDGYPVSNGLLSVTIVTDHSIDADALSTGVFALGYEQGRALVESQDNAEAVFVFEDMSIRGTSGAFSYFSLTDRDYHIINGE
ncbi:FAD:protein FMN transferase [Breznakiella homolactica]|uniref:FAD:protein FMN transferase n=1 Tax=Breznakiella homolactica TaxID=2798577 RepID=A0A7T8BC11_9SPIR|nr:FAD:protein FMN transferase [Breznakiella homolactica]QQO09753.1 FAD:protein FMN transferase [Breznakiella homolactica]